MNGGRQESILHRVRLVIARHRWIVLAGLIATVLTTVVLLVFAERTYRAEARMLLRSPPGDSLYANGYSAALAPDRKVRNEIEALESPEVRAAVVARLGSDDVPDVSGHATETVDIIAVRVESTDADTAAYVANTYVEVYIQSRRDAALAALTDGGPALLAEITAVQAELDAAATDAERSELLAELSLLETTIVRLQTDAALSSAGIEPIEAAQAPTTPLGRSLWLALALSVVAGFAIGLAGAIVVDRLARVIHTPDDLLDLGTDRPLLGAIPLMPAQTRQLLARSRGDDPASDAYRTLHDNIRFYGLHRPMQVIQVTSARAGAGSTTAAANLAAVIAQQGHSVVLVDANLRAPTIHRLFRVDGSLGIVNNLVDEPVDMTLTPIDDELWLIAAGPLQPNPIEVLSRRLMDDLVAELRSRFDYVVFDSPPAGEYGDAATLSCHADGLVMVVEAGRTSAADASRACESLLRVGAPLLGLVLNKVEGPAPRPDVTGEHRRPLLTRS